MLKVEVKEFGDELLSAIVKAPILADSEDIKRMDRDIPTLDNFD